ncbi:MAG: hypothetical protein RL257_560, partial [Actinomycetota bacterium]
MAVFVYGMIGYTVVESLENRYNAYTTKVEFVGLINYIELWSDPEFTHALSNLLKFTAVFTAVYVFDGHKKRLKFNCIKLKINLLWPRRESNPYQKFR